MKHLLLAILLIGMLPLAGCAHVTPPPVIKEVAVEVKVPVQVPCVKDRPGEVTALNTVISRSEWDELSTDQREKLLGSQSMNRKGFGDRLVVATAGCT